AFPVGTRLAPDEPAMADPGTSNAAAAETTAVTNITLRVRVLIRSLPPPCTGVRSRNRQGGVEVKKVLLGGDGSSTRAGGRWRHRLLLAPHEVQALTATPEPGWPANQTSQSPRRSRRCRHGCETPRA